jgi:hypothetical protein
MWYTVFTVCASWMCGTLHLQRVPGLSIEHRFFVPVCLVLGPSYFVKLGLDQLWVTEPDAISELSIVEFYELIQQYLL